MACYFSLYKYENVWEYSQDLDRSQQIEEDNFELTKRKKKGGELQIISHIGKFSMAAGQET